MLSYMDADWSVELGAEDEALDFPWVSPDGSLRYIDLKRHPEMISRLEECARWPELGEFLSVVNTRASVVVSAKSDVWLDDEISEAEEIYGGTVRFGSYVDLLSDPQNDSELAFSFERHERLVSRLAQLVGMNVEIPASAEFIVRRCYFHSNDETVRPGFYVTFYLFGYGNDEQEARQYWRRGLQVAGKAILQLSSELLAG